MQARDGQPWPPAAGPGNALRIADHPDLERALRRLVELQTVLKHQMDKPWPDEVPEWWFRSAIKRFQKTLNPNNLKSPQAALDAVIDATLTAVAEVHVAVRGLTGLPLPLETRRIIEATIASIKTQDFVTAITTPVAGELVEFVTAARAKLDGIEQQLDGIQTKYDDYGRLSPKYDELQKRSEAVRNSLDDLRGQIAEKLSLETKTRTEKMTTDLSALQRHYDGTLQTKSSEIEALRVKAAELLGDLGPGEQAKIFDLQAKAHESAQGRWLASASGAVALALGWLLAGPHYLLSLTQTPVGASWSAATTTFIYGFATSALFGLAIYCARVFRAERHNAVVNQHRRNALRAYKAIVSQLGDSPAVRDAVILEVTRTIFGQQPTGHQPSTAPADNVPLPLFALVADIAKNVTKDGK